MTKQALRKRYKEMRQGLTFLQKEKLEDLLLIKFQKYEIESPKVILSYRPFGRYNEFDPHLIERFCGFTNPEVVIGYPVIDKDVFHIVAADENTTFTDNVFGIEEPSAGYELDAQEIDIVIVPLLAFDLKGYRVGYGKGYYDRFLKLCRQDVVKAGFSFFAPEQLIDDIDQHDIPLDVCFTPEQTYTFLN
ncbi:MAG: 5-formyltetrahydrofolate cyclo-ligase [Ferruginibacter sp.]